MSTSPVVPTTPARTGGSMSTEEIKAHLASMFADETDDRTTVHTE
ncbi:MULTISPECIES: hypothetical protein [unclassified Rhodococcus (in: high G+C Gram-positive bacteria)]|nr:MULTISPECIES: hypothetical protein [unclassified Rhodococcus (in: high G+C Gram-positive bacteria)]